MGRRNRIDVGPSAAHRWSRCTASPQYILDNADQLAEDSSVYADEGTLAHDVANRMLTEQPVPADVPEIMIKHVSGYAQYVMSHYTAGSTLLVEQKVPLFYLPDRNGLVDASIRRPDGIFIDDLKYGVGVSVYAYENEQLAIYAESLIQLWEVALDFPDDLPVHLTIYQPRDRNDSEPVRTWSLTRGELRTFAAELGRKAAIALSGNGTFGPSDKACKFCSAKGICTAYGNEGLVALPEEVRPIPMPDVKSLTREQRVRVLGAKKLLKDWLEAVEDQEVGDLMAGATPMGYKLVNGKSNRVWKDAEAAQTLLSNHLGIDTTRPRADLISPKQAEEALKGIELSARFKTRLQSLIGKPEGKPTLVSEDDKRPALDYSTAQGLENLDVI